MCSVCIYKYILGYLIDYEYFNNLKCNDYYGECRKQG